MPDVRTAQVTPDRDIVAAVLDSARKDLASWFPDLNPTRLQAKVRATWVRPRCVLHQVMLVDGRCDETVVVKVRLDADLPGTAHPAAPRPTLAGAEPVSPSDMARLEFDGLSMIARAVRPGDGRFGVVRPLALLPDHAAVVMDSVDAPTMRSVLMASSQLVPRPRGRQIEQAFEHSGALLRAYHNQSPALALPQRQQERAEIIALVHDYTGHLGARTGDAAFFAMLERTATSLMEEVLPERLPLAVGHGDFVVRNLFVSPGGRVRLIDPMPRWLVPPYEDLARFVVGVRLLGMQVVSGGMAFRAGQLDRHEGSLLRGYFADDAVPVGLVRAYQLLVLLDKWAAIVGRRQARGWRRRLSPHGMAAHRYFRSQAQRLAAPPRGSAGDCYR